MNRSRLSHISSVSPVITRAIRPTPTFMAARTAQYYSTQGKTFPDDPYEQEIYNKLDTEFKPDQLMVKDVSGGCGSMFAIRLVSKKFEGLSTIKQHRMVNEVLKDDISKWHGLQLQTKAKQE